MFHRFSMSTYPRVDPNYTNLDEARHPKSAGGLHTMDVPLGALDLRESEFGWEHVHQKPCFFLVLTPQRLGFPVFNVFVFLVKPFQCIKSMEALKKKHAFFSLEYREIRWVMGEYTTVTHQMGIISFLNSPQCVYLVKEISGTRKRSEELQLFPFGDNFLMILDYAFIGLEI